MAHTTLMFSLLNIFFGGLVAVCAAYMNYTRNVVRAGFSLFILLLAVGGLFAFAGSDYAAVSQVVVYVGGVLLLVLFGLMLSGRLHFAYPASSNIRAGGGYLAAIVFLLILYFAFSESTPVFTADFLPGKTEMTDVQRSGKIFLTDYLFVFEMLSVFLLVALIGAAFISRKDE